MYLNDSFYEYNISLFLRYKAYMYSVFPSSGSDICTMHVNLFYIMNSKFYNTKSTGVSDEI